MDLLQDQDKAARRATLRSVLKHFRKRSGLRSAEMAKLMGKGLRTYQRWESGFYGVQVEPIRRFAEIVQTDPWGIIFAVEFGSPQFAIDTSGNNGASLLLVALRRFHRRPAGKAIGQLDPRSLLLIYTRGLDLLIQRAEEYAAELEQWMFDEDLGGGGDPGDRER